jgi:hypothetical protein
VLLQETEEAKKSNGCPETNDERLHLEARRRPDEPQSPQNPEDVEQGPAVPGRDADQRGQCGQGVQDIPGIPQVCRVVEDNTQLKLKKGTVSGSKGTEEK